MQKEFEDSSLFKLSHPFLMVKSMDIAIITGASSGLGKVFFEKVVERYPALDEGVKKSV